jgi:hypothetical protein
MSVTSIIQSKSTDKLIIIQEILEAMKNSLGDMALNYIEEVKIDWQSVSVGDEELACPTLTIKFKQ